MPAPSSWLTFLHLFGACFTDPSRLLFEQLVTAWALCPGRRTLTRLWSVVPDDRRHPYGAYARFIREGRWSMDALWARLAVLLIDRWVPEGVVTVLLDDTLINKSGRQVEGAGWFHDPVTSTSCGHKVSAWGLNLVVLALRVPSPWGGEPLALPLLVRLHYKGELSLVELAATMIAQLAAWLPERRFRLFCDGAYASLVGYQLPPTVTVVSRLRRDAALYELPPPRTGRRGRPRIKGARLLIPSKLADATTDWTLFELRFRARTVERLLWARTLLWYEVARSRPLLLVVVRDPDAHQPDDFFITNDTEATPPEVASGYADRWAIEDTNRASKQALGISHPQFWAKLGPERGLSLGAWLYAAVWHWYLINQPDHPVWPDRPWYTTKRAPSFTDALAALRRQLWPAAFTVTSARDHLPSQFHAALINVLAEAA